jgi:ankyrin repeat protein
VLKCLVREFGAGINEGALEGSHTPLIAASANHHNEVVRWLLKNGANAQTVITDFSTAANISKSTVPRLSRPLTWKEARTHCVNVGCIEAGIKKCTKCLDVYFCSPIKECQMPAWPAYKADCKRRQEPQVEAGKK